MDAFNVYASASRTIKMLDYSTRIIENAKVAQKSVHQIADNGDTAYPEESDMVYDIDNKHKYYDPYYTGNVIFKLSPDTYNDM